MHYIPLSEGRQYVPGIYCIESKCGKIYIGSAVSLRTRFMTHRYMLKGNRHDNPKLQNYVNKHGIDTLTFKVLELCPKENLLEREQYFIDTLNPFFNVLRIAGSTYGLRPWLGKKHSEETKEKISAANLLTYSKKPKKIKPIKLTYEENIDRIRNINKTPEGRQRCRELHLGNTHWLGKKHKPETIANRMGALNGRARSVYCLELDKTFGTAREACAFFGLSRSAVGTAIKRKHKVLSKYTVIYATG